MLLSKVRWNIFVNLTKELSHNTRKYSFNDLNSVCHAHKDQIPPIFRSLCTERVKHVQEKLVTSNNYLGVDDDLMKNIVGEDQALLKKFKILLLEMDVMKQDGFPVPSKMSLERWKELLNAPSRSQRIKLLNFLHKVEKKKENDVRKKLEKKKVTELKREEERKQIEENKHIHYGFGGSTIFLRVYDTKIDANLNSKLIRAAQFGQDIVIDCSFDDNMTPKEASLAAKQMMIMFSENRKHDDPFNLHFVNAHKEMKVLKKLHNIIPTMYDDDFPLNISEKSYLDLFPKEKLVYLTPHCRDDLKTYSHDDIYIIGCMVDKVSNEQLSLGKAKRDGLRMARLPLDKHLLWHIGTKSLTLNQVLLIMLEMKASGNWSKAFQHVPKRKLLTDKDTYNKPTKGPSLYRERIKQFHRF